MAAVTRLGLYGGPRGLYGSFAGKTPSALQLSGTTGWATTPTGDISSAAALSGSTGFNWAPTGDVGVAASLAGSTGFTWIPTGNLSDISAVGAVVPNRGGGFIVRGVFDDLAAQKTRELAAIKARLEEIKEIPGVDGEIAQLLHKDDEKELIEKSIKELEILVKSSITKAQIEKEFNARVAGAFARAATQGNFSAIQAFERELERLREEEDFLMVALMTLQ